VAAFLKNRYNKRRRIRWQKRRKARGKSIDLAPRFLNPGRNPWYLRPNAHTLRTVGRSFLESRKMMRFSTPADEAFRYIKTFCPKTAKAAHNLRFSDDPEVRGWFAGEVTPVDMFQLQSSSSNRHESATDGRQWREGDGGFWETGVGKRKKRVKRQKGASTRLKEEINFLFKVEGPDRLKEKRWRKRRRQEAKRLEKEREKEEKERELQELLALYGDEAVEKEKRAEASFEQHFAEAIDLGLKAPPTTSEEENPAAEGGRPAYNQGLGKQSKSR
jgi:hypothetical protein